MPWYQNSSRVHARPHKRREVLGRCCFERTAAEPEEQPERRGAGWRDGGVGGGRGRLRHQDVASEALVRFNA